MQFVLYAQFPIACDKHKNKQNKKHNKFLDMFFILFVINLDYYLHDVPDELFEAGGTFLFRLLFQVISSLPEVDLKCFGTVAKDIRSVEHLDASLGGLNVSVENVADFVV